jgi:small subunit ribosomal protein S20
MPVTKSAKKALRVGARRKAENLITKALYKKAVTLVKKAVAEGADEVSELLSKAQSSLDKAAKGKSIHKNKASRLKSRLAKKAAAESSQAAAPKKAGAKKSAPKKTTTKKATTKKK